MRTKLIKTILLFVICFLCTIAVSAVEPAYRFVLTTDGQSEKQVKTGDILTVYCVLEQTIPAEESPVLYAFQNEIEYDSTFFSLIEDSFMPISSDIVVQDIQKNSRMRELYVNYLSMTGGTEWAERSNICIFQVQVMGENGIGRLHCRDYSVSKQDGSGSYPVTADDLLVVINEHCTLTFDTCGGTDVSPQMVQRFGTATKPADPVRSGYRFSGWYTDEECTEPWQYVDPVLYNMHLYADWKADNGTKTFLYTDVQTTDWFYDGVQYVTEKGLMNGVSATKFAPNGETSRAMLVTILWRLAGKPQVDLAITFTDVEPNLWYTEAIRWAAGTGVVQGYDRTTFGVNDPVTREQMAVILHRFTKKQMEQNTIDLETSATDLYAAYRDADKISLWAKDGLRWAVDAALLRGVGEDMLDPAGHASRAQTATILMRFCEWIGQ